MENPFTIEIMTYKEWIAQITGGMSHREIAEAINTSHPTVGRNIRSGKNADFTITIAAHFGANPVEGLVQGDIINTEQIAEYAVDHGIGIEHYTDLDLARIIVERLEHAQDSELATVTEFPIYDVGADQYAADDSDTEPEEGEDGYNDGP